MTTGEELTYKAKSYLEEWRGHGATQIARAIAALHDIDSQAAVLPEIYERINAIERSLLHVLIELSRVEIPEADIERQIYKETAAS
jgi:hypothetical protein